MDHEVYEKYTRYIDLYHDDSSGLLRNETRGDIGIIRPRPHGPSDYGKCVECQTCNW